MLARAHRITRGADYRSVVRRGRRCVGAHLMSYTAVSVDATPSRFGFIVSKQVGSAVTRNTVRRRLKAISAGLVDEVRDQHVVCALALARVVLVHLASRRRRFGRVFDECCG